ncbi:hypothetical protein Bca101_058848 [Brassica carinata]
MSKPGNTLLLALVIYLIVLPILVSAAAEEENDFDCSVAVNSATALNYKIIAIFSTLIVGAFGVCSPIFGLDLVEDFNLVSPSVICLTCLTTPAFHILPDAIESLTSSCLGDYVESSTSSSMKKCIAFENKDEENKNGDQTHADQRQLDHNNIRRKLLTNVLESGIVVHSIIVGTALEASSSVSIIKPFIGAITFHQLLEGIRLGRCISKAKFELKKILIMVILFSLTTPVGIGIGIGVIEIYKDNGWAVLILSGCLNAAAGGILFYMVTFTNYPVDAHRSVHILLGCCHVFWLLFSFTSF